MNNLTRRIVIDCDFFEKITRNNSDELFKKIMNEYKAIPVVHQYIAEEELFNNKIAKQLIDEGYLRVIKYNDNGFLGQNNFKKSMYEIMFKEAYMFFNDEEPDFTNVSIFKFRKAHSNIGEIHSTLMAKMLKLEIFMSDDNGAKNYVEQKLNTQRYTLRVLDIENVFSEIGGMEARVMSYKELRILTKGMLKSEQKMRVKECWN